MNNIIQYTNRSSSLAYELFLDHFTQAEQVQQSRSNSVSGSACFVLHYFVKKDSCIKGRKSLKIKYPTVFVFVVWFIRVLASLNLCLSQISG